MHGTIAIIGAGISGLSAATRLQAAGHAVTVFDKGRGVGGRMATRRTGEHEFDHGAQYFTARGEGLSRLVETWTADHTAAAWFEGALVGTPAMTAPAKAMAATLANAPLTGATVTALTRGPAGWTVSGGEGPFEAPGNGRYAAVVLAVPAPQAIPLAATANIAFPELERVVYGPCWALMLAYEAPLNLTADHLRFRDGAIAWVARNGAKPGRDRHRETLVVHAAPDWSRRHLEETPQEVAAALIAALADQAGITASPVLTIAHRWRYALVEQPAGVPFLWNDDGRLGACGDWAIGPRVEAAFDSGAAVADRILAALEAERAA